MGLVIERQAIDVTTDAEDLAGDEVKDTGHVGSVGGSTVTQPSGPTGESKGEERRLRRLFVTTRSLSQTAEQAEDEREVVMTVLQAAAIWHNVDARAYRRDLLGRFVLDAWLPGADLTVGPRDFSVFSVSVGPIARISSTVEQQQLGWQNLSGELVLLPVTLNSQVQPRWVLAVPMVADVPVPPSLLLLCETLGLCLGQMEVRRARELTSRLISQLVGRTEKVSQLASAALEQVTTVLGAEQARLLMGPGAGEASSGAGEFRTMAAIGGEWTAGPSAKLGPGQSLLTPRRMTVEFAVAANGVAILDLTGLPDVDYTVSQAVLLEAAVGVIRTWLAGVLHGTAVGAELAEPTPSFEPRIGEELARSKHVRLETGLVVVDAPPLAERQRAWARAGLPLEEVLVKQLRSSDVIGHLENGTIGALLMRTGVEGTMAAAARTRRSLDTLAEARGLPSVRLGLTTFGMENESVTDVVGRASENAARHGDERER